MNWAALIAVTHVSMLTYLFIAVVAALVVATLVWVSQRAKRMRAAAQERELAAMAMLAAGKNPLGEESNGETVLGDMPSRLSGNAGIEVAEVVDLDELLAGEDQAVAMHARAQLEEPTNILLDDLETRPSAAFASTNELAKALSPQVISFPESVPVGRASYLGQSSVSAHSNAVSATRANQEQPRPAQVLPPAPYMQSVAPMRSDDSGLTASRSSAAGTAYPSVAELAAQARVQAAAARASAAAVAIAQARAAQAPTPLRTAQSPSPIAPQSHQPMPQPAQISEAQAYATLQPPPAEADEVSLRELALAWFEARGYRSSPASVAVRPIELVLRHKGDPARAYAFVVEHHYVTQDRVRQLRAQARSIGLMRLLVVALQGAEEGAADSSKGVRVMDQQALESEFARLDFSVAAKIIAVARKRSAAVALH